MTVILFASIVLWLVATAWSVRPARRRDWRWAVLPIALGLMALRQILALLSVVLNGGRTDLGAIVGEVPGLAASIAAVVAVILLDQALDGSQASPDRLDSSDRHGPRLVRTAVLIGAGAVLGCFVVGLLAYRGSREATQMAIARGNLATARMLADDGAAHILPEGDPTQMRRLVADHIEASWSRVEPPYAGSYVCMVGPDALIIAHSARPEALGLSAAETPIQPAASGGPRTVGELLAAGQDWSGTNVSASGIPQLVGYAYLERIGALVVVHTPVELIEQDVHAAALPWALALAAIAGLLLPLCIGLLHAGYARSQRSLLQTHAALAENEERFRQLAENLDEGFWIESADETELLYVSPACATITGRSVEELESDHDAWMVSLHPEDRQRMEAEVAGRPAGARADRRDHELRLVRPDGSVRVVWARSRPVIEGDGQVRCRVGVAMDVTERKQTGGALRASEARYRTIVEDLPDLVCRFQPDTTISFVNQGYAEYFGRSREELIGRSFLDLVPTSEHETLRGKLSTLGPDNPVTVIEHQVVDGCGEVRWQQWSDRALFDDDGRVVEFQSIGRDITDRKETERRQRLMMRELDHRVRNNIAALDALITMTARSSPDVTAFRDSIRARVRAMASVHEMLSRSHWKPISLERLVATLTPPGRAGALEVDGPRLLIPAAQATALGIVIHEMMTNSTKHGALGTDGGRVAIRWRTAPAVEGRPGCRLTWQESGGPSVAPPTPGVGTGLITGLVRSDLRGAVEFAYPTRGAEITVVMKLDRARSPEPELAGV